VNAGFGNIKGNEKEVMGLRFKNPIGLAAGFDKDAKLYNELAAFGFGFIEIGTLTPKPQAGNPKPRLFRLVEDEAVINRMGFNNGGLDEAVLRLQKKKTDIVIGGNIGKNKITPNEEATLDYLKGVEALHDVVDYFVVNVSSPNTPNLRELQEKEPLKQLLKAVQAKNNALGSKPLLLKIAPDLTEGQLDDIIEIINELKLDGIVATNTTISREGLRTPEAKVASIGAGGLSGKILRERSTEVIKYLRSKLDSSIAIIAVGGVFTGEDAKEKMDAGADLVQVWTGFLYEGPGMVRRILRSL
jgi:dihydroorotate dehydrogenase